MSSELTSVTPTVVVSTLIINNVSGPQSQGTDKKSDTWIAGAVVGPIGGLALIGAFFWFFLRRRRHNQVAPQQSVAHTASPNRPISGYRQQPVFAGGAYGGEQSPTLVHEPKYDVPNPYSPSTSPLPQQNYHEVDAGYGHMPSSPVQGSELSGATYNGGCCLRLRVLR